MLRQGYEPARPVSSRSPEGSRKRLLVGCVRGQTCALGNPQPCLGGLERGGCWHEALPNRRAQCWTVTQSEPPVATRCTLGPEIHHPGPRNSGSSRPPSLFLGEEAQPGCGEGPGVPRILFVRLAEDLGIFGPTAGMEELAFRL